MADPQTLTALLARHDPALPALAAPGRPGLDRAGLNAAIRGIAGALRGQGIKQDDRVALVLPNSAEMALLFLAVASAAVAAPLNAAYRAEEFDFYLGDLKAAAVLLPLGADSPVRAMAQARGIPVIEVEALADQPAGTMRLLRDGKPIAGDLEPQPAPGDMALILHTSGTTSRPKIVPLSHANLAASALNIGKALALTPADRCLVVMPLFHIHGLIGALTASLAAGASLWCPDGGFNALKFFGWLDESEATWYSAVPTMHQALLPRAERNREILARRKLRLIRSSSASLPPQVMGELETVFGCPVIESYGMTEACHQMTSNPLPPRARKPGSVGIAAGPDVAIMGNDGALLGPGLQGEIVIRGGNVTGGYLENPSANAEAFRNGWFRTGDLGELDAEGYLGITGRLKEIINRGGEKIAPREVDEALLDHPAVAQALTFAMPHAKLGEDVAAVVVLREGASIDERGLRDFVATKLADFKTPRRILFLDEIPKGATGKAQRIGLAQKLGLTA